MKKKCFMCNRKGEDLYHCIVFDILLCFECLQYHMATTECDDICSYCMYMLFGKEDEGDGRDGVLKG